MKKESAAFAELTRTSKGLKNEIAKLEGIRDEFFSDNKICQLAGILDSLYEEKFPIEDDRLQIVRQYKSLQSINQKIDSLKMLSKNLDAELNK
jgi:hypothetical protein